MPLIISSIVLFLAPVLSPLYEDPLWPLIFGALLLLICTVEILRTRQADKLTLPTAGIFAVAGLTLVSLLVHWLILSKGAPVYLDVMVRGCIFWLSAAAVFYLSATDRTKAGVYLRLIAIVAGASIRAGLGLNEYLTHLRLHDATWREFGGFSSPDFFAGQIVMTFPIALALFLGAKDGKEKIFWLPCLLAVLLQAAVIPTTGSRFGIISFAVGIGAVIFGVSMGRRGGMLVLASTRNRSIALLIALLIGAAAVAKPIVSRLSTATLKSDSHSAEFREWTWKGTAHLIAAQPVLGAGPGMFQYSYPRYAITGYTNHAHSSYLQTAADLGLPAFLILLASFATIMYGGTLYLRFPPESPSPNIALNPRQKGRKVAEPMHTESDLWEQVTLVDTRILVIGLVAALCAALTQNLVDSDWFSFVSGVTLFSIAGSLVSLCETKLAPVPFKLVAWPTAGTMALFGAGALLLSAAQLSEQSGHYTEAVQADPVSPVYQTEAAMNVYLPNGDLSDCESALIKAATLGPSSVTYDRLGSFYMHENNVRQALKSYQTGLSTEPTSVQLLDAAAQAATQLGDTQGALGYYQRIAALELEPYGTVRAIPEVSETRFADADAAIGDSLTVRKLPNQAISYYLRAKRDCEQYSQEGGASSPMRVAMNHMVVDTDLDSHMHSLYGHVLTELSLAYAEAGSAAKDKK